MNIFILKDIYKLNSWIEGESIVKSGLYIKFPGKQDELTLEIKVLFCKKNLK